jgi:hypothetical protein
MMQAAQSGKRDDSAAIRREDPLARRLFLQSEMSSILVVIADILREKLFQMLLIYWNHVIKQILATTFDPPFGYTILPRAFERGPDWTYPQSADGSRNLSSIFAIPVEDQEPGSRFKRKRFSQLLNNPRARWVLGCIEVENPTTIVANDEKAVEQTECDGGNREEVHRCDCFPVVV